MGKMNEHQFKCKVCGQIVDCRDLGQVLEHEHNNLDINPEYTGSKEKGKNIQWTKDKKSVNLN